MSGDLHIDSNSKGIAAEMEILHHLEGEAYWKQLKVITERKEFKPVEKGIYSAIDRRNADYEKLMAVSRKMVKRGYVVYILPNPERIPSADLILVRKGIYKMYDVKTITGSNSVSHRLEESKNQSKRVILHFQVPYNPRKLDHEISSYFNSSDNALEVVAIYGNKVLSLLKVGKTDKLWKRLCELFR